MSYHNPRQTMLAYLRRRIRHLSWAIHETRRVDGF